MSGHSDRQEDKTEPATARRLQRAREEGRVPISREVVGAAGLAAAVLSFMIIGTSTGWELLRSLTWLLDQFDQPLRGPSRTIKEIGSILAVCFGAVAIPVVAGAVAATVMQTHFALRSNALQFDFGRLSPRKGFARILGAEIIEEAIKSFAKVLIVGGSAYLVFLEELRTLDALPATPLARLPHVSATLALRLLVAAVISQVVIGIAEVLWLWHRHRLQLRMSRTEIRDEEREVEGDPAVRLRIRRLRMRRARQRMVAAVPNATVVVTNPTHYAVALSYNPDVGSAPRLTAKGVDSLALRIRELARQHGIPIVANPPLARALHQLPIDALIPPQFYKVVAQLIAYVWQLERPRNDNSERRPVRDV